MSGVNVLLFTECVNGPYYFRSAGAYRLATEIRKYGYTCQVIDLFTFFTEEEFNIIIDKYVGSDTLCVGFSTTFLSRITNTIFETPELSICEHILERNSNSINRKYNKNICGFSELAFKKIYQLIKLKNEKVDIIIGGANTHMIHYELIEELKLKIIQGYAENEFIKYILEKSDNQLNVPDFDFNFSKILWQPEDHIFPSESLPIEIARGCIFKCKFCSYPLNGKKKFDYIKDVEILREEFLRNYEMFGTTNYIFCDDTFNDSTYKLELLRDRVISKLPFKIKASSYIRLDLLNAHREQVELLNEIGLHYLSCGIESLNNKTQKYIGKNLPKDKMIDILSYIKNNYPALEVTGLFIFGLPYETKESINEMHKWIINDGLKYFSYVYSHQYSIIPSSNTEIVKNHSNLGYTLYDDSGLTKWKNENGLTYDECLKYALECNKHIMNTSKCLPGFYESMKNNLMINSPKEDNKSKQLERVILKYKNKICQG